jgi:hypothetical protein
VTADGVYDELGGIPEPPERELSPRKTGGLPPEDVREIGKRKLADVREALANATPAPTTKQRDEEDPVTMLEDRPTIIDDELDEVCSDCGPDRRYHGQRPDGVSTCFFPVGAEGRDCGCDTVQRGGS